MKAKECKNCHIQYIPRVHNQSFCSEGCRMIICQSCGKIVRRDKGNKSQKYCSYACSDKGQSKTKRGNHSVKWKGGKWIDNQGYVQIISRKYKKRSEKRYQHEHRLVMENYLGRKLKRHEHVHHIDGDKTNNDIKNLELLTNSEHARLHMMESPLYLRRKPRKTLI